MSDEHPISRRTSLKGIAASGALFGGIALGATGASAGKKKKGKKKDGYDSPTKKDGAAVKDVHGVTGLEFWKCHSMAVHFDPDYVAPEADGHVEVGIKKKGDHSLEIPISATNDLMHIPTADGTDAAIALPIGNYTPTDGYVDVAVEQPDRLVQTIQHVRVPLKKTTEKSIVVPTHGKYDGSYKIPLKDDGYLLIPIAHVGDHSVTVPLEDGVAQFPVVGGEADGAVAAGKIVRERDGYLKSVRVRLYNARNDRVENLYRTVSVDDLRSSTLHGHDDTSDVAAWTFNPYQFYDRPVGAGDKILAVTIDGTTIQNPNECAAPYQKVFEWDGTIDLERISLSPVSVDSEQGMARFRVRNANPKSVEVVYRLEDDDHDDAGTINVEARSATYLEVVAPEGEATVSIWADGKQLDERESATSREAIPRNRIGFSFECYDAKTGLAEFYAHNGTDHDLTFVYYVAETGQTGLVTVPDSLASAETFEIPVPDGDAAVGLFYEGETVGAAASDPERSC